MNNIIVPEICLSGIKDMKKSACLKGQGIQNGLATTGVQ